MKWKMKNAINVFFCSRRRSFHTNSIMCAHLCIQHQPFGVWQVASKHTL